jgi:succinoglycan biosynthesis protein ExoV
VKLYYYKADRPNFGDDINPWFWRKALGFEFDGSDEEIFVGIGTIINDLLPEADILHIFGSGAGYGNSVPRKADHWRVHCVRGPLTAQAIDVDKKLAVTDPVMLLHRWVTDSFDQKVFRCSFMPHVDFASERLEVICTNVGINYISPAWEQDTVIKQVGQSEKLITSAMHGAILADALRVPWTPVTAAGDVIPFKWHDWCQSLKLNYEPTQMVTIYPSVKPDLTSRMKAKAKNALASQRLKHVSKRGKYYLSSSKVLDDRLDRLEDAISQFKNKYFSVD